MALMPPLKCDNCGRFISYAELDSGASHKLVYPDSEYTRETWKTVCTRCNVAAGLWRFPDVVEKRREGLTLKDMPIYRGPRYPEPEPLVFPKHSKMEGA